MGTVVDHWAQTMAVPLETQNISTGMKGSWLGETGSFARSTGFADVSSTLH
jgi:hypothetical protein